MSDRDFLEMSAPHLLTKPTLILTQRIRKNKCSSSSVIMGDVTDEELIKIERKPRLRQIEHYQLSATPSSPSPDLESFDLQRCSSSFISPNISDEEFKQKCVEAKEICKRYVYVFFILEKISLLIENFSGAVLVLASALDLTFNKVIIIAAVISLVTILDTLGSWSQLREKYSHIYYMFRELKHSKSKDRAKEFHKYAKYFSSSDLFIDTVVFNEESN